MGITATVRADPAADFLNDQYFSLLPRRLKDQRQEGADRICRS